MTAAVILYAFMALMIYVSIMGTISHKPKRKHPRHTPEETHV